MTHLKVLQGPNGLTNLRPMMSCCVRELGTQWHKAKAWTNIDLSSMLSCGIHLITTNTILAIEICFKITQLKLQPHHQVTNELNKDGPRYKFPSLFAYIIPHPCDYIPTINTTSKSITGITLYNRWLITAGADTLIRQSQQWIGAIWSAKWIVLFPLIRENVNNQACIVLCLWQEYWHIQCMCDYTRKSA